MTAVTPKIQSAPEAFRKSTLLAQHISFLKDFFRAYKDFSGCSYRYH